MCPPPNLVSVKLFFFTFAINFCHFLRLLQTRRASLLYAGACFWPEERDGRFTSSRELMAHSLEFSHVPPDLKCLPVQRATGKLLFLL